MKQILTAALLVLFCGGSCAAAPDVQSNGYAKPENWLCLPGRADVCSAGAAQDATIVKADGTLTPQPFDPTKEPAIDCFYPTVVFGPGTFSDMTKTAAIEMTAAQQIARFGSVCSASDAGCVGNYSSFRSTVPPSPNTLFGKSAGTALEAACVNPASLGGGSGEAIPYFPTTSPIQRKPWAPGKSIDTPFVTLPGLLTAECAHSDVANYLAITVHPGQNDARANDIPGDVTMFGSDGAMGLHAVDMHIFMGNLVGIVKQEADAYRLEKR